MSPHYYCGLIGALLALPALWPALSPGSLEWQWTTFFMRRPMGWSWL